MLLIVLGGLFAVVLVYQLFFNAPSKPTRKTNNSNTPVAASPSATAPQAGAGQPAQPKATGQPEEIVAILMQDLAPLDLRRPGTNGGPVEVDKDRGNVFEFYKAPPPPPEPPPKPPPITLTGVSPASAVAGTPRKIMLTIVGSKIPEDAQVLFENTVKPSKRLSEHQIATDLEANEYASQRSINITVKSASDATIFSNAISFVVQAAPEPQFRYVGRFGEQGLFELPGGANKEYKRLVRGEIIMNQWRIDAINDQGVDLTHTQYEIKRRVPLTEKTR